MAQQWTEFRLRRAPELLPLLLWLLLGLTAQPEASASQDALSIDVPEGAPADTPLANLTALTGGRWSKFSLLNSPHSDARIFRLTDDATVLRASMPLVRHEVARRLQCSGCVGDDVDDSADSVDWPVCQCPLLLRADSSQLLTLLIRLLPRNNHAPEFIGVGLIGATAGAPVADAAVSVSELAEVNGSAVAGLPVAAVDRDSARFGLSHFRLEPLDANDTEAAGLFELAQPSQTSAQLRRDRRRRQRLSLRLLRPLDRERRNEYRLLLTAVDAGDPPLTGSLRLTVKVLDENDNRPAWLPGVVWTVNVSELAPDGWTLTQLRAADPDLGANGRVVYLLDEARASLETLRNFQVDSASGEVRLRRGARLDYERTKAYRVPVLARDQGPAPRQTEGEVAVRLLDENDEAPSITVHSLGEQQRPTGWPPHLTHPADCSVLENQPPGRAACYLLAADGDSGANAAVECSLPAAEGGGGDGGSFFELKLQSRMERQVAYQLVTSRPLDRESLPGGAVSISVSCRDSGVPPRRTFRRLRVAVLDENDSAPNFTRAQFDMRLDEELEPGTSIGRVEAVDADEWPALNYSLAPGSPDADLVSLDSTTGLVRSRVRFDRELRDRYQFQVLASDGVHTATANVQLSIADVNDHSPEWVGVEQLRVRENAPANTPVGRVSAIDRDAGDNGRVAYRLEPRDSARQFGVRPDGEVYVAAGGGLDLDRERTPTLPLTVVAFDLGRPNSRQNVTRLTVALDDENDNPPRLLFPSFADNRIGVSCRLHVGGLVAQLRANDSDVGDNARLTFDIADDGLWRRHFTVEPGSGNLTLAKPLDCSAGSARRLSLRVSAKDHGTPARFTSGALFIDLLEEPPKPLAPPLQPPQDPLGAASGRPGWRSGGSGRGGGVGAGGGDGGGAGGGGGGYLGADPGLAAVLCLIAATLILAAILAFAVCLLRRRASAGRGPEALAVQKRRTPASLTAKDISLPHAATADDTVAAAATAAAEQQLLMKSATRERKAARGGGGGGASPSSPPPYYYPLDPRYRRGPPTGRGAAAAAAAEAASQLALHDMGQHAYQTLRHHQPQHHPGQSHQHHVPSSSSYSRLPTSEFDCVGGGGSGGGSSFRTMRAASVRTGPEKSAATAASSTPGELRPLKTPYTTVSFV